MDTKLSEKVSARNYAAFVWHGIFFSLAANFTDIHSIIPSMLLKAGGNAILLGLLTTIMMGGSSLMQIVFAGILSRQPRKKHALILGINLRIMALFFLGLLMMKSAVLSDLFIIIAIFVLVSIFSFSGSYAGISYTDIVGKSILPKRRKEFFSIKQTLSSIGIFFSALLVRHMLKIFHYPDNYGILFISASILLLIASLGFWRIDEVITSRQRKDGFLTYFKKIPSEIKKNRRLMNYLIIINTLGLGESFLPFMILFAKKNGSLTYTMIGNILFLKIVGRLVSSLVLYKRNEHFEYKKLLYFSLVLAASLPILSLIFYKNPWFYQGLFVVAGVFMASYRIAKSGILIEISNDENRATYAGISGTGSILPTIFPLLVGAVIPFLGFQLSFLLIALLIAVSLPFIHDLNCKENVVTP